VYLLKLEKKSEMQADLSYFNVLRSTAGHYFNQCITWHQSECS